MENIEKENKEKQAETNQETVDTSAQETATAKKTTDAENAVASTEKDENKEASVPSWRLREESEKRRQLEERLAKLEGQPKTNAQPDAAQIRAKLRESLKPVLNVDTGEYEFTDAGLDTLTYLIRSGTQYATAPITNKMINAEIKAQKIALKDKPYFKELEADVNKALDSLSVEQKMQDGVVESVYKYLRGEKFEELAGKERAKITEKPQIVGDITPHKTKSNSGGKASIKLSPEQIEEFNANWSRKGFDENDYLELLGKMKAQDAGKGYKTERLTIGQSVSN